MRHNKEEKSDESESYKHTDLHMYIHTNFCYCVQVYLLFVLIMTSSRELNCIRLQCIYYWKKFNAFNANTFKCVYVYVCVHMRCMNPMWTRMCIYLHTDIMGGWKCLWAVTKVIYLSKILYFHYIFVFDDLF